MGRLSKFSALTGLYLGLVWVGVSCQDAAPGPLRVGVLLPLTGSWDATWEAPLEWSVENVNAAGGIDGRPLRLEYIDIGVGDAVALAEPWLTDDDIVAVIGPVTSDDMFALAPLFIRAKKPLVTPSATSADIFRAFGGREFIWRTLESDVSQVRSLLTLAAEQGATSASLITAASSYGATFFDWFGFMATELGLGVGAVVRYDAEAVAYRCTAAVEEALATSPDTLVLVPGIPEELPCLVREARRVQPGVQLIASDAARFPYVTETLGREADGLQGVALTADPSGGFGAAYEARFGQPPTSVAATTYDALLLVAYGLAYSGGRGGQPLADGIKSAVDARGEAAGWDARGVAEALTAISEGRRPDIRGAASEFTFDADFHTELTESFYAHWRVERGAFVDEGYFSTGENDLARSNQSAFRTLASEGRMDAIEEGATAEALPEREDLWALVVGTSSGWSDYRHQADALAQYQLLRANGVPDARIILILADDLAAAPENDAPGVVRNAPGGDDLRADVVVDYRLEDLDCEAFLDILAGRADEATPDVIGSGPLDNLYVFVVGHGSAEGVLWSGGAGSDDRPVCLLSPEALADELESRQAAGGYRQALIVVEACHGGAMGRSLDAPHTLLLAGANPYENSQASNFDLASSVWLADEFAFRYWDHVSTRPGITLGELYESLYFEVTGSHVSLYNSGSVANAGDTPLAKFVAN